VEETIMLRTCVVLLGALLVGPLVGTVKAGADEGNKPPVPAEKIRPSLTPQLGHTGNVFSVAFSPDGKLVLTGSDDHTARLWDVATGKELRQFTGITFVVSSVAFSPDGKKVLTGDWHGTVRLWDVLSGEVVSYFFFSGHTHAVHSVVFSSDGKQVLTGSTDMTARLWDAATGKELRQFKGHTAKVNSVAISRDGKQVLTGSADASARLWDAESGKELRQFTGHKAEVLAVAISSDGKLVLTGHEDNSVRLWDAATGKELRQFTGHTSRVTSVSFSSDGKQVLTGAWDGTARLWDPTTGKELRRITDVTFLVESVAFSPDGKQVLTGNRKAARLWDATTGREIRHFTGLTTGSVNTVAFSPDGKRLLTGVDGKSARLWDLAAGKEIRQCAGHTNWAQSVAFSPDGKLLLTGSDDKTPRLWDAATGKELRQFIGHTGSVYAVVFTPDGKQVLTGSNDNSARLWDAATGKELRQFTGHKAYLTCMAFSANGKLLLTGSSDTTARLWDVATGKELRQFSGHLNTVFTVAFSPDGKQVFTGSWDKSARLWDTATGNELHQFTTRPGKVIQLVSASLSPDGKQVLTGDSILSTKLWDAATGKELHHFTDHVAVLLFSSFSPDGKKVLTGSKDQSALMRDAATGAKLHRFSGHTGGVNSAALSPDGKHLLTGSGDNTARLWDAATGKELVQLISFADGTWAVVDTDGRFDASNGGDIQGLHWVVGNEPIALKQLKERYYDPGLLAKHLGFNKEPLRKTEKFEDVKLFPEALVAGIKPGDKKLTIDLTNRGGGIGRVQVLVNGKELLEDARGPKPNTQAQSATLTVDLSGAPLLPGQPNKVEVVTWNSEGYLSSRGRLERIIPGPTATAEPIQFHAIVVGVGSYANPALNLRFAAKDAEDFATAVQLGGNRLFGADRVHVSLLTTSDYPRALKPTKENLARAFADLKKTRPGDVLVVYLAGHGAALQQGNDLYCYLTADARSLDPQTLADPAVRAATSVSSEELTSWIKAIPALKQVMVLDTCAAGAAAAKLNVKRDISGDQVRAIERLKDRTGFHVLMGCSADRVSYEASQYAQGLLTYSLLEGMSGAALQKDNVDVSRLFQYAADRVPELARHIGGVQRPVVSAPQGTSFDVGRLEAADRAKVPLARVKPLVLRPALLNQDEAEDNLKLTALLQERLSDASHAAGRGKDSSIVYVAEDDFPGAVRPTGIYTVADDKVSVRLTLKRDGAVVAKLTVEGKKNELSALAEKMAQAILDAAK
jgi:WD40 repeat protein/uncharacterized caspase-like protein